MSLLNANQNIHIPLYYTEKKSDKGFVKIVVLDDDKAQEMIEDDETKGDVQVLNTQWKTLTWKEQNDITKQSLKDSGPGFADSGVNIDGFLYRDLRIKHCLKDWDLTDDDGQEIPCTPEKIDDLPSEVVFSLVSKYDDIVLLGEDEEKK